MIVFKKIKYKVLFVLTALLFCGLFSNQARGQFMQGNVEGLEKDLERHVNFIASDSLLGRAAGSKGELAVANYIYDELEKAGVIMLSPRGGEDFYIAGSIAGEVATRGNRPLADPSGNKKTESLSEGKAVVDTIHSRNIIGLVQGYDKNLRGEYVVIGAHIDHLGVNKVTVNGKQVQQIYPGADDNASGVATLIELAKQVVANKFLFRRSVIFAFFGAEEIGMAGSWYFLNRSFKEVDKIVMMINLDMVGRSSAGNQFQVFTGIRNLELNTIVNSLSQRSLSLQPVLSSSDYFPSDHRLFYEKEIPIALFTTGVHRDYHSPRDLPQSLDYTQMEKIAEFAFALTQEIANREERLPQGLQSITTAPTETDNYYTQHDVDKRALFLHGDETQFLQKWVYPYIKYPDSAVKAGEGGRVIAEFIIEKDGKVTNVVITKGITEEIDDEVIKVISASPKWKPARMNGQDVRVKTAVAVDFKLSKNAEFKLKK